jgi:hypothetical protein
MKFSLSLILLEHYSTVSAVWHPFVCLCGEMSEEAGEGKIRYSSLKIALITIQLLCTALYSGILFGWAPFQLIMMKEGLYECSSSSSQEEGDGNEGNKNNDDNECLSQQSSLNMLFTIATSTFLISSLFIGIFVDHYGVTSYQIPPRHLSRRMDSFLARSTLSRSPSRM